MAMRVASASSSFEGDEDFDQPIIAEINITPLTDVFLVLLIIFMVTSSVLSKMGVQGQLPKSNQAASANATPGVIVTVTSTGDIFVNGARTELSKIGAVLKARLANSVDKTVVLEGDRRAVLGTIVQIMDEGKKAGATKFAVATSGGDK